MRYANVTAASYVGIDLHARTMYVVVLDARGDTRLERNLTSNPDAFLSAISPFLPDVVVACATASGPALRKQGTAAALSRAQRDTRKVLGTGRLGREGPEPEGDATRQEVHEKRSEPWSHHARHDQKRVQGPFFS
jgi:hypothetical protein